MKKTRAQPALSQRGSDKPTFLVLTAISFCHFLNDTMQSLLLAGYPLLKTRFDLSFVQIGLVMLTYQFTASLLQPLVGYYADRRPRLVRSPPAWALPSWASCAWRGRPALTCYW